MIPCWRLILISLKTWKRNSFLTCTFTVASDIWKILSHFSLWKLSGHPRRWGKWGVCYEMNITKGHLLSMRQISWGKHLKNYQKNSIKNPAIRKKKKKSFIGLKFVHEICLSKSLLDGWKRSGRFITWIVSEVWSFKLLGLLFGEISTWLH